MSAAAQIDYQSADDASVSQDGQYSRGGLASKITETNVMDVREIAFIAMHCFSLELTCCPMRDLHGC